MADANCTTCHAEAAPLRCSYNGVRFRAPACEHTTCPACGRATAERDPDPPRAEADALAPALTYEQRALDEAHAVLEEAWRELDRLRERLTELEATAAQLTGERDAARDELAQVRAELEQVRSAVAAPPAAPPATDGAPPA